MSEHVGHVGHAPMHILMSCYDPFATGCRERLLVPLAAFSDAPTLAQALALGAAGTWQLAQQGQPGDGNRPMIPYVAACCPKCSEEARKRVAAREAARKNAEGTPTITKARKSH